MADLPANRSRKKECGIRHALLCIPQSVQFAVNRSYHVGASKILASKHLRFS